jgi:hypothetical protein
MPPFIRKVNFITKNPKWIIITIKLWNRYMTHFWPTWWRIWKSTSKTCLSGRSFW